MNDDTRELIGASIRTTLVGIPMPPGCPNLPAMIAQGWSEYENHLFKTRVEEFFTEVRVRLKSLEATDTARLERLLSIEAQTALLEESVSAASREPDAAKRHAFSDFYVASITGKLGKDPDSIRSILQTLEALTPTDLSLLARFKGSGFTHGEHLVELDDDGGIGRFGISTEEQEASLAPIHLSVLKLENRGLVQRQLLMDGGGFTADDETLPLDHFKRQKWKLTYVGRQLLTTVSPVTALSTDH